MHVRSKDTQEHMHVHTHMNTCTHLHEWTRTYIHTVTQNTLQYGRQPTAKQHTHRHRRSTYTLCTYWKWQSWQIHTQTQMSTGRHPHSYHRRTHLHTNAYTNTLTHTSGSWPMERARRKSIGHASQLASRRVGTTQTGTRFWYSHFGIHSRSGMGERGVLKPCNSASI